MATISPDLPAGQSETFIGGLLGMASFLFDPPQAARHVRGKWFWVGPLVVFSLVSIVAGFLMMPIVQHVLEVSPIPDGVTPERYQRGIAIGTMIQKVAIFLAPLGVALIFSIQAAVLLGTSSMFSAKAKFRELFNLVAGCGLIQAIAAIAAIIVLKSKGEISSRAELRPALGLDIFLPEGTNRFLAAFLGYFSVFEIWWIVMLLLTFAAAFRVSKAKALAVILPLVLLNLLWRIGAAAFQR
jgi:Yip1-like protein